MLGRRRVQCTQRLQFLSGHTGAGILLQAVIGRGEVRIRRESSGGTARLENARLAIGQGRRRVVRVPHLFVLSKHFFVTGVDGVRLHEKYRRSCHPAPSAAE